MVNHKMIQLSYQRTATYRQKHSVVVKVKAKVSQLCPTFCDPMTAACQASLSFTISYTLLKFMSIESVMPSSHLILCHPLFLLPVFGSHSLLQGIVSTQGLNPGLLHFRLILYHVSHQESPKEVLKIFKY